jgi:hypothetical protein
MEMTDEHEDKMDYDFGESAALPGLELLTESELVQFLRIPQVSSSKDYHDVIEHLKRYRNLPRIHICSKVLYPTQAIREWIEKETTNGK